MLYLSTVHYILFTLPVSWYLTSLALEPRPHNHKAQFYLGSRNDVVWNSNYGNTLGVYKIENSLEKKAVKPTK